MPPPVYASTTLAGKPWSRWSAELLGRWTSWVSCTVRAFGQRWSTTVLRRCMETTGMAPLERVRLRGAENRDARAPLQLLPTPKSSRVGPEGP